MQTDALPISVASLFQGRIVEWERLEFKKGWNPQAVLHTMCAFANDFHNLGGGYIVVGVEERNGRPRLPPAGVSPGRIDAIQKELLRLGNNAIRPAYHPRCVPVTYKGRTILVIWAPAGETRPYRAKRSLSKGKNEWCEYIRRQSSTVVAKNSDLRELIGLTATVPFDDRYNQRAGIDDLSLRLIEEFLREVGSDLAERASELPMDILGRQMNIVGGTNEAPFPKNIGLMMFNEHPEKFFPVAQIDVVYFPDGAGGDVFEEKEFKGPLHRMTRDALSHIKRNYLKQIVIKRPDRAEADRVWNYPYAAIEEGLVNAVYHRSYEIREPVEVRIFPEKLMIISFPGPDRSLKIEDIAAGKAASRRYRNRRVGDFLKELELTEGRSTGIGKIKRALASNGSPDPVFETDADYSHFTVHYPVHPEAMNPANPHVSILEAVVEAGPVKVQEEAQEAQDEAQKEAQDAQEDAQNEAQEAQDEAQEEAQEAQEEAQEEAQDEAQEAQDKLAPWQIAVLAACGEAEQSRQALLDAAGYSRRTGNFKRGMRRLLDENLLEMTQPDRPSSKNQKYRLTRAGKRVLDRHPVTPAPAVRRR